jgi:pentatricopeptide repeat protein
MGTERKAGSKLVMPSDKEKKGVNNTALKCWIVETCATAAAWRRERKGEQERKMAYGIWAQCSYTYNMLMVMLFEMGEAHRAIDIWLEMDRRGCQRAIDEVIDRDMKLSYKKFDAVTLRLSAVGNLRAIHQLSEHMRRFLQCCYVETICNHSEEE